MLTYSFLQIQEIHASKLGLLITQHLVICLKERHVNDRIHYEEHRHKEERYELKACGDEDADRGGRGPRHNEAEAVHAHDVDEELGEADVEATGEREGDEHIGVQNHGSAEEQRLVHREGDGYDGGFAHSLELLRLHEEDE